MASGLVRVSIEGEDRNIAIFSLGGDDGVHDFQVTYIP
jgi:hypothetical protein